MYYQPTNRPTDQPTGRYHAEVSTGQFGACVVVLHHSTCKHHVRLPYPSVYVPADTIQSATRRVKQLTVAIAKLQTRETIIETLRILHTIVITEKVSPTRRMESPKNKYKTTKHNTATIAARQERPATQHRRTEVAEYNERFAKRRIVYSPPVEQTPPTSKYKTPQELNHPVDTMELDLIRAAIDKLGQTIGNNFPVETA